MPRQPKRTETLEQARANAPASMAPAGCCFATAASSSNDAAIRRSGLSASLDPIAAPAALARRLRVLASLVGKETSLFFLLFFWFLFERISLRYLSALLRVL